MESVVEASPLDTVPEVETSKILKSLCHPTSTIPSRTSGQIVYGCALLLGELWEISLWWYSEIDKIRWECVSHQLRNAGDMMTLHDVGSFGKECAQGLDVFSFWSQTCSVLLHLDPCSSPADHPEPDPGPVAQPGVLWRPRAHNSGCAAADDDHWGHSHHLEAAPEPHCSSLQGR